MKTFTLATFNVHGWQKFHKQKQYRIDYVSFKKQNFSSYQIYLWTITKSYSSKLNLHTTVMVSFSLGNGKTMFTSIGMCQIELVSYKSQVIQHQKVHIQHQSNIFRIQEQCKWGIKPFNSENYHQTRIHSRPWTHYQHHQRVRTN